MKIQGDNVTSTQVSRVLDILGINPGKAGVADINITLNGDGFDHVDVQLVYAAKDDVARKIREVLTEPRDTP